MRARSGGPSRDRRRTTATPGAGRVRGGVRLRKPDFAFGTFLRVLAGRAFWKSTIHEANCTFAIAHTKNRTNLMVLSRPDRLAGLGRGIGYPLIFFCWTCAGPLLVGRS